MCTAHDANDEQPTAQAPICEPCGCLVMLPVMTRANDLESVPDWHCLNCGRRVPRLVPAEDWEKQFDEFV